MSKRKYPDGIQIFNCDAKKKKKNVDLKKKFQIWQFDQKMCLKVITVAIFMVRGISLIKNFCVVDILKSYFELKELKIDYPKNI